MNAQDVVRARDLMLVFWTDSTLRRMDCPGAFVVNMRQRAVCGQQFQGGFEAVYMAAIIPSQDEEFICDKAKEIP